MKRIFLSVAISFPRPAEFHTYETDGRLCASDEAAQEISRKYIL